MNVKGTKIVPRWIMRKQNPEPCCHYCGKHLRWSAPGENYVNKGDRVTLDHIIPKSEGGSWHTSNLVIACLDCNQLRGPQKYEDFVQALEILEGKIHGSPRI